MRGFLVFLVLAIVGLGAFVFFALPALVGPLVINAVRDALPFGDQSLQIDVSVSGLGLLDGRIDAIHVRGANLTARGAYAGVSIGTLDLTALRVQIGNHAFDAVSGGLDNLQLPMTDGHSLSVTRVDVSGGSTAVSGAVHFSGKDAVAFITRTLAGQGVAATGVELGDGGVSLVVFGKRLEFALGVEGGALIVPDAPGGGSIPLLEPGTNDRWRLTGVSVTPDAIQLDAVMDADALLART